MRSLLQVLASKKTLELVATLLIASLPGCGTGASFNDPLSSASNDPGPSAIEPAGGPDVDQCQTNHLDVGTQFVGLALSGGGARAAVFSAATIFELADLGVMDRVDVISGASGGALAAAYYAVTCDGTDQDDCMTSLGRQRRSWNRDEVLYDRLSRDFLLRSLLWRLEPYHMGRTIFTAYDNTDIFAAVLADSIYDEPGFGRDFKFSDLNPKRPFLVINATNATGSSVTNLGRGRLFTFTKWRFDDLQSDLCSFKVGRAVAASSAYPGIFNYSTLSRYDSETHENIGYVHLFDAGASDNLAIDGLMEAMKRRLTNDQQMTMSDSSLTRSAIVFVIDAQNGFDLQSQDLPDPRSPLDRIVDRNFLDVYDTMMERNYTATLADLNQDLQDEGFTEEDSRNIFHLALKALKPGWPGYGRAGAFHAAPREGLVPSEERGKLLAAVNNIKTDYGLDEREAHCLAASAHVLVYDLRPRLEEVFGKLQERSEEDAERFWTDLDACLSEEKREAKALFG